ncbi:acyl carrier protein [Peptococcaceae bacterium]|nr:acyl carrier protein [Peptococcaceae bacterium]
MDDIFERMQRIIVEQLDIEKDQVTLNSSFVDDLGADSLDIVELVMAMEEEFDMQIPDEEAERIHTVGDAVKFVQQKMQ